MGEYDRIQKKQESRAVANSDTGSRQLKGFVDINNQTTSPDKVPIQMLKFRREDSNGHGELESKDLSNQIIIAGWLEKVSGERITISGSVDFHIDSEDPKRLVIGTITCTPKRTGAGSVLIYLLACKAVDLGMKLIGTDLSALEEGTPEFYQSIGLAPPDEWVVEVSKAVAGNSNVTNQDVFNILYSARLDGMPSKVKNLTEGKLKVWKPI